jgi:hypothetical protein
MAATARTPDARLALETLASRFNLIAIQREHTEFLARALDEADEG